MQALAAAATAASSGSSGSESSQQPAAAARKWPGAKPLPLLLSVGVGLALRFLVPVPAGLTLQGWTLLSIFTSTIAGARRLGAAGAHIRHRFPSPQVCFGEQWEETDEQRRDLLLQGPDFMQACSYPA